MPPTIMAGPETSIQNVDNNVRGMDANVYELEPNVSPLTSLTSAMGSISSDNPKAEWLEDEALPRVTTVTGIVAIGTFVWPVTLDIFRIGDVVRASGLGWGFLVTAHSAGSVTGTVIGTQTATTATTEFYIVSNANPEGGTLREIEILQLVTQFNYDEIIRTPFGVTTTELGTLHYGGDERARLSKKFGIEHARAIEQMAFFGLRGINGTTRTAGGLLSYIATNVTPHSATTMTVTDWETFLVQGFRYGGDTKVAYCSPLAISAIEAFARNNLRVSNDTASTYGVKMSTYVSGQGEVHLVKHKDWADSAVYKGYVFLVDMDHVKLRPLRNVGQTQLLKDRQAPDYDGVKDEYRSETCLQVIHERNHALMTGVQP